MLQNILISCNKIVSAPAARRRTGDDRVVMQRHHRRPPTHSTDNTISAHRHVACAARYEFDPHSSEDEKYTCKTILSNRLELRHLALVVAILALARAIVLRLQLAVLCEHHMLQQPERQLGCLTV